MPLTAGNLGARSTATRAAVAGRIGLAQAAGSASVPVSAAPASGSRGCRVRRAAAGAAGTCTLAGNNAPVVAQVEPGEAFGVMIRLAPQPRPTAGKVGRQGDNEEPGDLAHGPVEVVSQVLVHELEGRDRIGVELVGRDWTPRELRHSFVSLLSDAGVPLENISRLVGHRATTVTGTIYRKQLRRVIDDAVAHG